ncbi:hypothetical protein OsI_11104 [Oryza sativa Indica Group]|uniref:Uncharacterized protein n=1 Tax=Oryza sativa subsp. indica TaxID=39946 RepID=A2XFG5_ORYSI|nr:hypothetical protein OsI_11104 [Oryza sativa Indica Group]
MKYDVDRMIKPLMNAFVWCMHMRDTSIVGIDGADNRTLQHVRSSGDGAESVIPLIHALLAYFIHLALFRMQQPDTLLVIDDASLSIID